MLLSLTLTNFQKHRTFNHAFQAGLTLVTGENWRGKTSIIRGLLYALFGSTASQVRAANLVSRGEKTMEVQLVFRSGDLEYEVTRGPVSYTHLDVYKRQLHNFEPDGEGHLPGS